MTLRSIVAALGSAVTTFLVVGAVVIEALTAATGADVGPGIVGVGLGAIAAIAALVLVRVVWGRLGETAHWTLLGYAAFGLAFLVLAALSYVNVPGARASLSVPLNAGIAALVAVAVAVAGLQRRRARAR